MILITACDTYLFHSSWVFFPKLMTFANLAETRPAHCVFTPVFYFVRRKIQRISAAAYWRLLEQLHLCAPCRCVQNPWRPFYCNSAKKRKQNVRLFPVKGSSFDCGGSSHFLDCIPIRILMQVVLFRCLENKIWGIQKIIFWGFFRFLEENPDFYSELSFSNQFVLLVTLIDLLTS